MNLQDLYQQWIVKLYMTILETIIFYIFIFLYFSQKMYLIFKTQIIQKYIYPKTLCQLRISVLGQSEISWEVTNYYCIFKSMHRREKLCNEIISIRFPLWLWVVRGVRTRNTRDKEVAMRIAEYPSCALRWS